MNKHKNEVLKMNKYKIIDYIKTTKTTFASSFEAHSLYH